METEKKIDAAQEVVNDAETRNELCKAFLIELDNRVDEFNASLHDGYGVVIDNPLDLLERCSWGGKNLSVTLFHTIPRSKT